MILHINFCWLTYKMLKLLSETMAMTNYLFLNTDKIWDWTILKPGGSNAQLGLIIARITQVAGVRLQSGRIGGRRSLVLDSR